HVVPDVIRVEAAQNIARPGSYQIWTVHRDASDVSSAPVMPHEIDRLCQLLKSAGEPVAISVGGTVKAGRDCGAKSGWRQTNNVVVAQMRDEIVPDRPRFRISVNENNGHPSFSQMTPVAHTCRGAPNSRLLNVSLGL